VIYACVLCTRTHFLCLFSVLVPKLQRRHPQRCVWLKWLISDISVVHFGHMELYLLARNNGLIGMYDLSACMLHEKVPSRGPRDIFFFYVISLEL
jgi:hypothetical protein